MVVAKEAAARSLAEDQYDSVQPQAGRVTELVSELVSSRAWSYYPLVAPTIIEPFRCCRPGHVQCCGINSLHAWPDPCTSRLTAHCHLYMTRIRAARDSCCVSDLICDIYRSLDLLISNKPCCVALNKADVVANCHQMDSLD